MADGVRAELKGGPELIRTLEEAPAVLQQSYRHALPHIAEPTRIVAEHLALTRIRRMWDSPDWARMRVVVGEWQALIVPAARGSRGSRSRPNLADLLEERAIDPAAEETERQVERDLDRLTERLLAKMEADGP